MEPQTIRLNEDTVATVLLDSTAQDPRSFDSRGDRASGYGIHDTAFEGGEDWETPPSWVAAFLEISERQDENTAFRALNILRSMGVDIPVYVGIRLYQGSFPFSWARFIITGPTRDAAESHYRTFEAFLRGDVFGVQIERKCPVTGDWFTADTETPIWGIYGDSDESFPDFIRSVAEINWALDAEPISPAGARLAERRSLDGQISEKLQEFYELTDEIGESRLSQLASEIFTLYADLGEEYAIELDELQ